MKKKIIETFAYDKNNSLPNLIMTLLNAEGILQKFIIRT